MRWSKRKHVQMDRKSTKTHHVDVSLERLYLPRGGGRRLQSLELLWEREVARCVTYLFKAEDTQVQRVMQFQGVLGNKYLLGTSEKSCEKI